MLNLDEIKQSLDEATQGFKQMQYALLAFAAITAVAMIVIAIKIFKA